MERLKRASHRLLFAGLAVIAVSFVLGRLATTDPADTVLALSGTVGTIVGLVGALAIFLPGKDLDGPVRTVHPPVAGRWLAVNSPASKVPSHGTRGYGQSYAIDLVYAPADRERPVFGVGPGMRPPSDYPAFGEPVLSMVSGTVVRVRDRARDHRSRSRLWSLLYFFVEGAVRELGGAGRVIGNHVVVDAGDGCYALVAHLRRGSALVRVGEQVRAGQPVGRCGNSGNSTEPHVHAQLMDRADASTARGLPIRFAGISVDGGPEIAGLPGNGQHLTAGERHLTG